MQFVCVLFLFAQALFQFFYDASMAKRHALNTVQPAVAHNYSDVGFALSKMPEKTFK